MKKINILMIMLITSFLFMACEKDDNSLTKSKNEIENKKSSTLEVEKKYQIMACAYNDEYTGVKCVLSTYHNCPDAAPCQPITDNDGNPMPIPTIQDEFGFTDDQMHDWKDGANILESTVEFVKEHYDFYLHTYDMGVSLHPDEIIDNLEE